MTGQRARGSPGPGETRTHLGFRASGSGPWGWPSSGLELRTPAWGLCGHRLCWARTLCWHPHSYHHTYCPDGYLETQPLVRGLCLRTGHQDDPGHTGVLECAGPGTLSHFLRPCHWTGQWSPRAGLRWGQATALSWPPAPISSLPLDLQDGVRHPWHPSRKGRDRQVVGQVNEGPVRGGWGLPASLWPGTVI